MSAYVNRTRPRVPTELTVPMSAKSTPRARGGLCLAAGICPGWVEAWWQWHGQTGAPPWISFAMLCAECDGGQYANDQGTAVGGCAGCLPCFEDGCSRHHLPAEKCGRRCSSTDASTWQDGLVAILRNALCKDTGRKYRPLFSLLLFSLAKSLTRLEELRDERNLRPKIGSPTPLHYPLA